MISKIFIVLCGSFVLLASLAIYQEYKPRYTSYNNNFDDDYESTTGFYDSTRTTPHYPTLPEVDEKFANETNAPSILDFDAVFNPQEFFLGEDVDDDPEIKKGFERYEVHTFGLSWFDAVLSCWRSGGRLATPENAAEARLLGKLLQYTVANANITNTEMKDTLYIGVSHFISGLSWTTVEGVNVRFEWWLNPSMKYRLYVPSGKSCASIISSGLFISVQCRSTLIYACDMEPLKESVMTNDDGYVSVAHVYNHALKLHLPPLTWPEAQEVCLKEGASLAAPNTYDQLQNLTNWLFSQNSLSPETKSRGVFLGFNDIAIESTWVDTNDNRPSVGFTWYRGLADGSRAENCLVAMPSGTYDDVSCNAARPFVCQKSTTLKEPQENVEYVDVEGLGSYVVHTEPKTWWDAVMVCRSENASLVVPASEREVDVLTDLFAKATNNSSINFYGRNKFYVGVHDSDRDHIWRTIEGKRVFESGFNKWFETYDIYADERCALLKDKRFKSTYCENKNKFICKKIL